MYYYEKNALKHKIILSQSKSRIISINDMYSIDWLCRRSSPTFNNTNSIIIIQEKINFKQFERNATCVINAFFYNYFFL